MTDDPRIYWQEDGRKCEARWRSARMAPPPTQVRVVDDGITADEAYGQACQGIALLWRGDFHNARQLLAAIAHRADRRPRQRLRGAQRNAPASLVSAFNRERQWRAQRSRTLGMLLVELQSDYSIALRRAPDWRAACVAALGPAPSGQTVLSLRELQGIVGAYEWRTKGLDVPEAGGRIHPHYGVFAPVRSEYVRLVASAPLPSALAAAHCAFDIGTGTGVLAAVLAKRGIGRVIATDQDIRAIACARENLERLGWTERVQLEQADLYPSGRAALVVCNPPWIPARPSSPLENAVYDYEGKMLSGFLRGLGTHLVPGGEGWLVLSDLAEHLGLRSRAQLLADFDAAGLQVLGRLDVKPTHPRALDETDPLHTARKAELTSLWRLGMKPSASPDVGPAVLDDTPPPHEPRAQKGDAEE
jgi:SAM-dependent methyltransferase